MENNQKKAVGSIMGLTAMALAWIFYGWQLPLSLMLALWANNLERSAKSEYTNY